MIVTRSIYTHCAIQIGDELFEANGGQNFVGYSFANRYAKREVSKVVLDISEADARTLLEPYDGAEYDYRAVHLWFLPWETKNRYYCSEVLKLFLIAADFFPDSYKKDKVNMDVLLNYIRLKL